MARLSKTGGKARTGKARKAKGAKKAKTTESEKVKSANTKRRIAPVAQMPKHHSIADLTKELKEAREQQAAAAEILKVINSSPGDLTPVFEIILEKAHSLCDINTGSLELYEGDIARSVAARGMNVRWEQFLRQGYKITETLRPAYMAVSHSHVIDMKKNVERFPDEPTLRAFVEIGGLRTFLALPLVKDGVVFGRIIAARDEVRPFTDKQIALLQSFADQAVIAIENARLLTEQREALERQTATSEVLQVISSSVSETAPVFEKILDSCQNLIACTDLAVLTIESDNLVHLGSTRGSWGLLAAKNFKPIPVDKTIIAQAVAELRTIHVPDSLYGENVSDVMRRVAQRVGQSFSCLIAPMKWQGSGVGALFISRVFGTPFTQNEISLFETFADQAVIAIQNARMFNETKEALERQTATADILKVIASSPDDVQPVFQAIAERSKRLVDAQSTAVFRLVDGMMHLRAFTSTNPEADTKLQAMFPAPLSTYSGGESILRGEIFSLADADASELEGIRAIARLRGFRSVVVIPLLHDEDPIGLISVTRVQPGPFADHHVQLLQTFADQAVIAIQNVRLFNETREALERQAATADVLRVISGSVADTAPVFAEITRSCERLFTSGVAGMMLIGDDGLMHHVAWGQYHQRIENADDLIGAQFPRPVQDSIHGYAIQKRRVLNYPDVANGADVPKGLQRTAELVGHNYSIMVAPMLWEDRGIGALQIVRAPPMPFSEKDMSMLQTFADQAVIAIQNARMFNETKEALERQTATADILKVIASSPSDVQPVFDAIAERSKRLVDALSTTVSRLEDGVMHLRAFTPTNPEADATLKAMFPAPLSGFSWGEAIGNGEIYRVVDTELETERLRELARLRGFRSMLFVPLLRDRKPIGVIAVTRVEPGPFVEHHVNLLQTFADQAVIAIENVRLFDDVQAKTRDLTESLQQQTATAEVLKVISRSAFDLDVVLNSLTKSAVELCNSTYGVISLYRDGVLVFMAQTGCTPDFAELLWSHPAQLDRKSVTGRTGLLRTVVQVPDVVQDKDYDYHGGEIVGNYRSAMGVPLLRDGELEGVFTLMRGEPGSFTQRQVELVETFADQAVIAIDNARLFKQLQARTSELSLSLDELRAAQDRLVQTEKLASLGQLTAGIAHEIKNPLNFVNNFSALSVELIDELNEALKSVKTDDKNRKEIDEISEMLKSNVEKIESHGKRADSIVKNMLLHSRSGASEHRSVDINAVVEESLNLAYHGARAEKSGFNITLKRDLDPKAGMVDLYPQEITRVFLNLFTNGFYAANKRKETTNATDFESVLSVATKDLGNSVEIRIRDNGTGIPDDVKEKMFNPFFTTKPAGEGTGLGLSMSHDIVVKQHGGRIDVETQPDSFTEFLIVLPRSGTAQVSQGSKL